MAYNQIHLPVNLHPALDHSVKVSSISLHEPPHIFKISSTTDEDHVIVIVIATREGSLCPTREFSSIWYPSLMGGGKVVSTTL